MQPKQTRTVGFAYGLGSMTGDDGRGQLGMTAGGEVVAGKEFTLTAYVKNPAPGATVTLALLRGLELAAGSEKQSVDPVPAGSSSPYSPVTWKVKATKAGVYQDPYYRSIPEQAGAPARHAGGNTQPEVTKTEDESQKSKVSLSSGLL